MLISVYIPTKNRAKLLAIAIESVRAQTHQDFEVIVVDDGSTDETQSYLAQLAAQEPRLRYNHPTRSLREGPSLAMPRSPPLGVNSSLGWTTTTVSRTTDWSGLRRCGSSWNTPAPVCRLLFIRS